MISDPIADFLSRIKNGYLARKAEIIVSYSKFGESLAKILMEEGYIEKIKIKNEKRKMIELTLKYEGKKPALTDLERVSTPGLRIYVERREVPKVLGGLGIAIISTSQGLMTDKEARKKRLGGEVICKIW